MTAQQERLRSVAVSIRTKPTPLSDFIPLLNQTADYIDALTAENERLKALADSEGTRAVEYLRRARHAEVDVERLRKDAERYRWIKSAKGLTLESERGGPWTRENGGTFTPSHRLCAGGTQFAPYETLDDAIDTAMKGTP